MNNQKVLASQILGSKQRHDDMGGTFQIVGVWRGEFQLQTGRGYFNVEPEVINGETITRVQLEYYRARLYVIYLEKLPSSKFKARVRLAGYIYLSYGNYPNGSNRKPVLVNVKSGGHSERITIFTTGEAGVRTSDKPLAMITPIQNKKVIDAVKNMYLMPGHGEKSSYDLDPLYVLGNAYESDSSYL